MRSIISNNLTKKKEEQHPRSFQSPLNVQPATDHTIQQSTNSGHATDVIEFITVEENVKWDTGRGRVNGDTRRTATRKSNQNRFWTLTEVYTRVWCVTLTTKTRIQDSYDGQNNITIIIM